MINKIIFLKINKLLFTLLFFCVFPAICVAQQMQYHSEIGVYFGAGGKTSQNIIKNIEPAFGLMYREKFDKRLSLRLNGGIMSVFSTYFDAQGKELEHNNRLFNLDLVGEFNFFDFEDNPNNRNARKATPYIFVGIGGVSFMFDNANGTKNREYQPIVPFGLGVKVKIAPRWNLNLQYTHRIGFTDKMEGIYPLSDINNIKGTNFMNKDVLSVLSAGITFDFWRVASRCLCE